MTHVFVHGLPSTRFKMVKNRQQENARNARRRGATARTAHVHGGRRGAAAPAAWEKEHVDIRQALEELGFTPPTPPCPREREDVLLDISDGLLTAKDVDWRFLASVREHDMINLMEFCITSGLCNTEDLSFIFLDVTEPTNHARMVCNGAAPVGLTTHKVHLGPDPQVVRR